MICPQCNSDFEDSYHGLKNKKKVTGYAEHYGEPYRLNGLTCPACGHVSEFIQMPTGNLFPQNLKMIDPKIYYAVYKYLRKLKEEKRYDEYRNFTSIVRAYLE